ncbi:MAG: serpin family protein [Candidatus Micrarchaeota archaeon]
MFLLLIIALALFISGCASTKDSNNFLKNETNNKTPEIPALQLQLNSTALNLSTEEKKSMVEASNQFAFDLYSKQKTNDENVFFSPYSISSALAITYEGAKGQTAQEIQKVFYFSENESVRRSGFASIYNNLNKANKSYNLSTANALWIQKDYSILQSYKDIVKNYYGAEATNVDFVNQLEQSRLMINNWIENETNQKIKDMIGPNDLDQNIRLIITNAIYFKGSWETKFDKSLTKEEDFEVTSTKIVKAQMMKKTKSFNYFEDERLQILELPYKDNELSMLIILPKEEMTSLESNLSLENLNRWKQKMQTQEVDVSIPKFKFQSKYYLGKNLIDLGMSTSFDSSKADFSGITGNKDLSISEVIHQAFVEVNEEGTEAAAATAVEMKPMTLPSPPVFKADHPFIFIIQDKGTGSIIFIGKVNDPTKG